MRLLIKKINLFTLKDAAMWTAIRKMVVPGWCAESTFGWFNRKERLGYTNATLLLLYKDKTTVGWNLHLKTAHSEMLWAFTKPYFRRKGYQKLLLAKSKALFGQNAKVQLKDIRQKKAFKYYKAA